jgi:hypothetical protein
MLTTCSFPRESFLALARDQSVYWGCGLRQAVKTLKYYGVSYY